MATAKPADAVIGHNNPPTLLETLAETHASIAASIETVAADANKLPKKIKDDDDVQAIGRVVVDARKITKQIANAMKQEKEPHIEANKTIGGFFGAWTERVGSMIERLEQRATDYQNEKAAEARRVAKEEADKQRKAADEARAKAEALSAAGERGATKALNQAEALEAKADRHERTADASAADLTRTRDASGLVASAKTTWKGEIVRLGEIDLEALRPFIKREAIEAAITAYVRMGNRELKGARIFEETKAHFKG